MTYGGKKPQPIVTLKKKKPCRWLFVFVLQQEHLPPLPLSFFPVPCEALEPFFCFRLPQVRLDCEHQCCGLGMALCTQAGGEQRSVCPHFPEALEQGFLAAS